jgi:hypothetical protein
MISTIKAADRRGELATPTNFLIAKINIAKGLPADHDQQYPFNRVNPSIFLKKP